MVIKTLYETAKENLHNAGIEDCEFDAMCIIEDFTKIPHNGFMTDGNLDIPNDKVNKVLDAVKKRCNGYPLQYILGKWEFYGYKFKVGEGVLIPRPDTETLVDTVLEHFKNIKNDSPSIIDLCSGSGCIAISLKGKMPNADIIAVENSSEAMPYLLENARLNNVILKYIKGDVTNGELLNNFKDKDDPDEFSKVDCIVSNPPYLTDAEMNDLQREVTFEPDVALRGGFDGLKFYRVISCLWKEILKKDGLIAFEIGYTQAEQVAEILKLNGYSDIKIIKDLGKNDRVICGINK